MGLLKQREEIESKMNFYWKQGATKDLLAWVCDIDGSLRVDSGKIDTIDQSKAMCQWYLSICDEL